MSNYIRAINEDFGEDTESVNEYETIEIPISESDFQNQLHDLVYGDGEKNSFEWVFYTQETNKTIKVRFVSEDKNDNPFCCYEHATRGGHCEVF